MPENSDGKRNPTTLDVMVTSTKDNIIYVENYRINNKPAGMFKLSLSDDEESYDNYMNCNRTDSSTSSLASLSEKYEDPSMLLMNEDSIEKKDDSLDTYNTDILEADKTTELSSLEPKPVGINEEKSFDTQNTLKDSSIGENSNKNELYENINALFIKGFYLGNKKSFIFIINFKIHYFIKFNIYILIYYFYIYIYYL